MAADGLRLGVVLQPVDPPDQFVQTVRLIEELGYEQLWLTDSSLHARYVFSYLTLAATTSERLQLGSGVTNPVTRHPALLAAAGATIDEISGGRLILGIGAGDRPLRALGARPASLRILENSVLVLRRLLAGERVSAPEPRLIDAQLRIPPRPNLPIYVSASGPRTLELGGRIADGVILLAGLFEQGIDYALSHIRRGANAAGRPAPTVAAFLYGSIRDDRALAITEARSIAAWFPQTAPVYSELVGMSRDVIDAVRNAYTGGEFQEAAHAAELIPDEIVARLALAGTAEDAAQKIRMLRDRGISNINIFPLGHDRIATIRQFAVCTEEVASVRA